GVSTAYANLWRNGTLQVTGQMGGIPFTGENHYPNDAFVVDGALVTIAQPGTYYISFNVNIPAADLINTNIVLQANNANVADTYIPLEKSDTGENEHLSGNTILTTTDITVLRLSSSSTINITADAQYTLAKMTIIRIL
ncbi:MAG: hypothetical protein Q4C00_01095, partial [Bacillota bacterium]|nr:hypothetical protein [Bacillota bacterium]